MATRLAALVVAALCVTAGALAVSGNGTIYTVAGTGAAGFSGDGAKATSAQLNTPAGVAIDGAGNVYVADAGNHRIRKVTPAGVITTIAGTGSGGFSGDGGPATSARLFSPLDVALDGRGNFYIADNSRNRVEKVSDLTAELGTVGRAWVSATRAGSASKRISSESREIWAHFVFAESPANGLPIVVEFYGPRGRLGAVQKPRAPRVDAVLRRQSNAVFALGRWRVILRVAGKPVKTISSDVKPFRIK